MQSNAVLNTTTVRTERLLHQQIELRAAISSKRSLPTNPPFSLETETEKVEYEFEFLHDNNVGHDRIIVAVQLTNEQ